MWGMIAGMGIQILGGIMKGNAQDKFSQYNANLLDQKAKLTKQVMESETGRSTDQARKLKAEQRVAYSASGAMTTSGTPLLVMAEQAGDMQKDILNERRNRMREIQALESQADIERWQGKVAKQTGWMGAGGTLLNSGAGILGNMGGGGGDTPGGNYGSAPKMDTLSSGGMSYGSY